MLRAPLSLKLEIVCVCVWCVCVCVCVCVRVCVCRGVSPSCREAIFFLEENVHSEHVRELRGTLCVWAVCGGCVEGAHTHLVTSSGVCLTPFLIV